MRLKLLIGLIPFAMFFVFSPTRSLATSSCLLAFELENSNSKIRSPFPREAAVNKFLLLNEQSIAESNLILAELSAVARSGVPFYNETPKPLSATTQALMTEWESSHRSQPENLPAKLQDQLKGIVFNDFSFEAKVAKLRNLDFEIEDFNQLKSVVLLFSNSMLNHEQYLQLLDSLVTKSAQRLIKPIHPGSSIPGRLMFKAELREKLAEVVTVELKMNEVPESLQSAMMFANSFRLEVDRKTYAALKLIAKKNNERKMLVEQSASLKRWQNAKEIEKELASKIDFKELRLNDVQYSDFNPDAAASFLEIAKELGPKYAMFIEHIGVLTRPQTFIRDVKKLSELHLSPNEVWKILSSKQMKLYRKVSVSAAQAQIIRSQGMKSGLARQTSDANQIRRLLLTAELRGTLEKHIEGATSDSPLISLTPIENSVTAYTIASHFATSKVDPIVEYEIDLPIYDVMTTEMVSADTGKFEFLAWNQIDPLNVKKINEEPRGRKIEPEEVTSEVKKTHGGNFGLPDLKL